jgi:Tetratricopeptide repeat
MEFRLSSAAIILVVATYLFLGGMGVTDPGNPHPRDAAYNQLARGLLEGHLYAARDVPAALAHLPDPYDPAATMVLREDPRFRLQDFSYVKGRLYLYFGIAPALLVFIPWHLLTGGWLPHWAAVVFLCSGGVLVNLSLVSAIRRRTLPRGPEWIGAACTLILGLGSYAPLLLARADMWEIPIAFGTLCVSIALRCLWEAFVDPARSVKWIALASATFGAGFAARPTILPNAAILLLPFVSREVRLNARAWFAAVVPLAICGAAVALYNDLRFGSPFEFGQRYQLAGVTVANLHLFSSSYFWTNLRFYLVQPVRWTSVFPFAHETAVGLLRAHLPLNHGGAEHMSGALLYSPILWAACAVPLAFRAANSGRPLVLIAASATWVALSSLALLCFFFGACSRYQFEFVPEMALLACVGVMAMEATLSSVPRIAARCAWVLALLVSCTVPVLYGIDRCAADHNSYGVSCLLFGNVPGAESEFATANMLSPGNPFSRLGSALILISEAKFGDAEASLEELVRDFPDYAKARLVLGNLEAQQGRIDEAVKNLRVAHQWEPEDAAISAALTAALARGK